jgi:ABC-type maltose transport system permease subunit
VIITALWLLPFGVLFVHRKLKEFQSPQWAFIDRLPKVIVMEKKYQLGVKQDLILGLVGGVIFNLLLLAIRVFRYTFIPEAIRNTPDSILQFFYLFTMINIIIGIIVMFAITVRSRQFGEIHGLFGAYIGGIVSSIGFLVQNLIFGGGIDIFFTLDIITSYVVYGAVTSFPIGVILSVIREKNENKGNLQS